jgi:hypothetical protein
MHQMVPQFRVLAKVDAPCSGLLFYQRRMLGFKLIDSDEGVETNKSFFIFFCNKLISAMYDDRVTKAMEAGCQPALVKSQRVEGSMR